MNPSPLNKTPDIHSGNVQTPLQKSNLFSISLKLFPLMKQKTQNFPERSLVRRILSSRSPQCKLKYSIFLALQFISPLHSLNSLSVSVTTRHCQGRRRPTSTLRAGAAAPVTATPPATPTRRGARMRKARTAGAPAATAPDTPARR